MKHYIKFGILFFVSYMLLSFSFDWIKHPENIDYMGNLVGGLSGLVGLVIIFKFFVKFEDKE